MTIILFLVDTSASMNQRTYLGTSLLDIAKSSVENFMKIRSRDPNSRWDRYMLLTLEDHPANIKAGWKESHATFISELKNIQSFGLTTLGQGIKHAFDLLNVNRMQSGIDTYGQGRCPYFLEPAMILVITDGGKLTSNNNIHMELNLPNTTVVPGAELTKEPFRWDQRVFALVLKLSGCVPVDINSNVFIPSAENHPVDAMCEVTGGRSYAVYTQKMLSASIESLVQKVHSGVVIHFEKIGPDPPPVGSEDNTDNKQGVEENGLEDSKVVSLTAPAPAVPPVTPTPTPLSGSTNWQNCTRLIFVPRSAQKGYSVGYWPIPEAFWPDVSSPTLPSRTAHPDVKFSCTPCEPMVVDNLPFDKYELEPSPLTQFILERRQPNTCWQVFINNSAKYSELGHPFGYLKASSSLTAVNLFVMPYNYPVLLPLLDELFKVHKLNPNNQWRQRFENYLKTMPGYYAQPLKRALARMGAHNISNRPDSMENPLSYSVITYLKKLKNQAKMEMDRLIASVGTKTPLHEGIKVSSRMKTSILQRKDFSQLLQHVGGNIGSLKQELTDYNTFTIAVADKDIKPQYFRNPYDIPRKSLLDQIARMRTNFLKTSFHKTKLLDDDQLHSVPIQQMGNYQEYLKKQTQPLRELENTPTRVHMFGNPFKVNKNIMVDEAEDSMLGQQSRGSKRLSESPPASPGPKKRKPGPLPRDVPIRRPSSSSIEETLPSTPPASPAQDMEQINYSVSPGVEDTSQNAVKEEQVEVNHTPDTALQNTTSPIENHVDFNQTQSNANTDLNAKNSTEVHMKVNNSKRDSLIWTHNTRLKHTVYRELKRPGRSYENVFSQLNTVQGSVEIKCAFIRDVIREAARFKKKVLIQLLEQFEKTVIQTENKVPRTLSSSSHMIVSR